MRKGAGVAEDGHGERGDGIGSQERVLQDRICVR